ncbi:hypothetical protein D3C80_1998340 [compost metagenome]
MTTALQAQQLAVEPDVVKRPGFADRHLQVVLGVHHETGDIQLVAPHVQVRRGDPRVAFHFADEIRPRLRRQPHEAGETAQGSEDAAGR